MVLFLTWSPLRLRLFLPSLGCGTWLALDAGGIGRLSIVRVFLVTWEMLHRAKAQGSPLAGVPASPMED